MSIDTLKKLEWIVPPQSKAVENNPVKEFPTITIISDYSN